MYHVLLSNRYLTSRLIPLIAVAAVALCVALVIIVVSVMTGFLEMVKNSGRVLMGDVVIAYPISGIPHYQRLLERLEKLESVHAATPVADGLAVMRMPYEQTAGVQFWGIEPKSFAEVTGFADTLYWEEVPEEYRGRLLTDLIAKRWKVLRSQMSVQQQFEAARLAVAAVDPASVDRIDQIPVNERAAWLNTRADQFWVETLIITAQRTPGLRNVLTEEQWTDFIAADQRLIDPTSILDDGLAVRRTGSDRSGIVLGIHVAETNRRERDGTYSQIGRWWMPREEVTLSTLPIDDDTSSIGDPETLVFDVVNEFVSGVFVIDETRCFVSLDDAQFLLHMDEQIEVDPDDPDVELGVSPARVTMVLVRATDGVSPDQLREEVMLAYDAFVDEIDSDTSVLVKAPARALGLSIKTWQQQQAHFIGPVEKERELMRTLFSIVYLVCAGLVLAIFWAIVFEKTRDIGILRAVGASRTGIAMIFLRYGAVIGVLGAIVGALLAWGVTYNIQAIHDALGERAPRWVWIAMYVAAGLAFLRAFWRSRTGLLLPVVLWSLTGVVLGVVAAALMLHRGTIVWDPAVYMFSTIPNEVDQLTVVTTMIGAVIFSILGAVIPAAKAADTDPVNALRYE